jgi:hypothetical protein
MRVPLKISKFRVWFLFLLFLFIDEIDALDLIFNGLNKGQILMIFGGFWAGLSSLAFFISLVFVLDTPIDIITRKGIRVFCLVGRGREVISGKMFGFLDTFFEEHDFGDVLKVELILNGESFESDFRRIEMFIFWLDLNVLKDIRIGNGEVVKVEGEVFVLHVLKKIRSNEMIIQISLQLGSRVSLLELRYYL